jgi:hypothetical protein
MSGVGKETIIQLHSGIVDIEGYMKFEHVVFVLKIYFRFSLLHHNNTVGDVSKIRFAYSRCENYQQTLYCTVKPKSIGRNNTSATIYLRNYSLFLE